MATRQPAILPEFGPYALYGLIAAKRDARSVNARCKQIHGLAEEMNTRHNDADMFTSIAFENRKNKRPF